jgi:hypothetical protein
MAEEGILKITMCVRLMLSGHSPMKVTVPLNPETCSTLGSGFGSIPLSHANLVSK